MAERSRLRCPHCGHVIATAPKSEPLRGALICPGCDRTYRAPTKVGEVVDKAIRHLDEAFEELLSS